MSSMPPGINLAKILGDLFVKPLPPSADVNAPHLVIDGQDDFLGASLSLADMVMLKNLAKNAKSLEGRCIYVGGTRIFSGVIYVEIEDLKIAINFIYTI